MTSSVQRNTFRGWQWLLFPLWAKMGMQYNREQWMQSNEWLTISCLVFTQSKAASMWHKQNLQD